MGIASIRKTIAITLSIALLGCDALPRQEHQRTEEYVNKIGIVRLSLGQPILLDKKMRDELKPEFALTSDEALKMSVPTSAAALRYTLDAMIASLQVAGPSRIDNAKTTASSSQGSTADTATKTETLANGTTQTTGTQTATTTAATNTKNETEKGRSVGDASKVTAPSANAPKDAARASTVPDIASIGLGIDPSLRYLNAMSLLMSVRTLNQTIDRISPPKDWDAYIVPIRISLSPQGRGLPYELRSTIVFSGVENTDTGPKVVAGKTEPAARIIPIATDNHDVMSRTAVDDIARSFGLGLGFVAGLTGINAQFGKQSQNSQTFRANDIHSVMTAGQAGENALDVRFGSMRIAEDAYTAVERTHIVIVVVMVPKGAKAIMATSTNSFVHTTEGTIVDRAYNAATNQRLFNILTQYNVDIAKNVCECSSIMKTGSDESKVCAETFANLKAKAIAAKADEGSFTPDDNIFGAIGIDALRRVQQLVRYGRMAALRECLGFDGRPNADFALVNFAGSVVGTLDESRYSKAIALIPKTEDEKKKVAKPLPKQTALLKDDETIVSTQLRGGENLSSADSVQAFLIVNKLKISSTSIKLDGEDGVQVTFPSLKGFVTAGKKTLFQIALTVDSDTTVHEALYQLASPKKPEPKPKPDASPKVDASQTLNVKAELTLAPVSASGEVKTKTGAKPEEPKAADKNAAEKK
jgi:hypothetical protein